MDSILQKFRGKFIDEAHSLLDRLETDLLELEKDPKNIELIESAFRAMHTLKGVSGMYGFNHIGDYTHHMESIYQSIREKTMEFSREIFDISFASIDHIRKLLADENLTDNELARNHELLQERIQLILCDETLQHAIQGSPIGENEEKPELNYTYNILLKANEKLYFRGVSITDIFRDLAGLGEFTIEKVPVQSNAEVEVWSIFLKTKSTKNDILDVLLFIEDDCIINRVGVTDDIIHAGENPVNNSITEIESIKCAVEHVSTEQPEPVAVTPEISSDLSTSLPLEESDKTNTKADQSIAQIQSEKQSIKRISVDSSKLDQLMFLVSELITVNSSFMRDIQNPAYEPLRNNMEKLDNLSKSFRNNAIEIRLVPLSDTILRFQRLIRDLSRHLNKKVELKTYGVEVELDKNTVDQLAEPLMHMIRNCIDHGIEMPQQRIESGKPETGTIKISANQSGNFIYLSIEDDGVGIDTEKIRKKAVEKGFINVSDNLTKSELLDLIFLPGFSTAQSLTDISGRGVGMDVVRRKINDLRGEVILDSEVGKGTTFTLKIQQSLSILDTLLFKIEQTYFTIPVSDIELCDDVDIQEINQNQHTSTIEYINDLIPFIDLRKALKIRGSYNKGAKKIIIKNSNKTFSILADTIIGEHQAVLKPLGKAFFDQPYITAASQLGDGNMAFMLDIVAITKNISKLI